MGYGFVMDLDTLLGIGKGSKVANDIPSAAQDPGFVRYNI